MKKMILTTAFSIFTLASLLIAQPKPNEQVEKTPEEKAMEKTDHLANKLGLDDQQKEQVYNLTLESIQEMDAYREELRKSREKFQAQRKELLDRQQDKLKSILNEEQFHQFELARERRIGRMQARRQMQRHDRMPGPGKPKGPPPEEMPPR